MTQFILKINLGNDAMLNHLDVAKALHLVAQNFEYSCEDFLHGTIPDINGNTVGSWQVK